MNREVVECAETHIWPLHAAQSRWRRVDSYAASYPLFGATTRWRSRSASRAPSLQVQPLNKFTWCICSTFEKKLYIIDIFNQIQKKKSSVQYFYSCILCHDSKASYAYCNNTYECTHFPSKSHIEDTVLYSIGQMLYWCP
jgi:hypothetical protein